MQQPLVYWHTWGVPVGVVVLSVCLAVAGHWLVFGGAAAVAARRTWVLEPSIVRRVRAPARLLLALMAAVVTMPVLPLSRAAASGLQHLLGLALITAAAWVVVELTWVADDVVSVRYAVDRGDNLQARMVRTQVAVLRRVAVVAVLVVAAAAMLMTFPSVEALGAGLLASAGIAGIAAGLALQPALANLVAGIQIALTQPIRLDDVVVINGEWGNIEEITSSYVVVRIWDRRRLVVPFTQIIGQPFENWTRHTADLLGTVFVYADYSVPVEEVRQELHRILQASGMWDGQVWGLQVTNATDRTLELRALMSAPDSSTAWNLRCHVREQLVSFLRERHPESLPRVRAELRPLGDTGRRP